MRFSLALFCFLFLTGISSYAQTQTEVAQGAVGFDSAPYVDGSTASILIGQEESLLNATICASGNCDVKAKNFYAIIHILVWPNVPANATSPATQNWYVFHAGSLSPFTEAKRLYGARKLYVLYIHLNVQNKVAAKAPYTYYTARYELQITKTTPANLSDVFGLASLAGGSAAADHVVSTPSAPDIWGGREIEVRYVPSSIQIDPRYVKSTVTGRGDELSAAQTFSNEGKYWWDVSVGVPIKKISDLSFNSTNNTATTSQTSTTNAFALLDLYYPKVDLSGTTYSYIPHPVVGVAMAGQPLHKILVGGAVGLHFAELYAGVLFVKQQSLTGLVVGSPATPAQLSTASTFGFKPQFTVGINIPIRSALQQFKKAQTSTSK